MVAESHIVVEKGGILWKGGVDSGSHHNPTGVIA